MTLERLSLPIAIVVAGAIIGGSLYYSNIKAAREAAIAKRILPINASAENMRPISGDDHILGNPNAEVIIVEYSDLECPYCKEFQSTMRQVMNDYGKDGKVAWVYRHFPIDDLHSRAKKEAEATECANELGGPAKFWEYTNLVYDTTTSNNTLDPAELPKIAKTVGLNVADFNSCLSSGRYAAKVENDFQDALKAGGRGTPHSILVSKDGTQTPIQGAWPYDNLKQALDALLSS